MQLRPVRVFMVGGVLASVAVSLTLGHLSDLLHFGWYAVVCAVGLTTAVRRRRAADRRPWLLIAGGQVVWLIGDAVWPVTNLFGWKDSPVASAVFWTAGYLAYGVALTAMARRRAGRWLRHAALDMLTLTTAVAIAIWVIVISPYLADAMADPMSAYLAVTGPLGDVILTAGILLLVLSPGLRGTATRLLVASALLRIVSDLGSSFLASDRAAAVSVGVTLLSNSMLIAAALHPGSPELTTPARSSRTLHPARVWFLGVALLTGPTIAFVHKSQHGAERTVLFVATIVSTIFVLIRFASAVRSLEHAEEQLSFQASHDPLTGLANRTTLAQRLDESAGVAALLYIDLDGFKAANEAAGHAAGDAVLREVATRLTAAVRATDTVARLGGDEFAVLLPEVGPEDAIRLADRLLDDMSVPVEYEGQRLAVGASIGIAAASTAEDRSRLPGALLRSADTAMYNAKRLGRGRWVLADQTALAA